ncbi:MAG TPA: glycosyl hydrolase family 18 protein [Flavobacteriales bacterium]|nr:glycosyl hydrolase family 18 protein [Flavobacteriales bacterium]
MRLILLAIFAFLFCTTLLAQAQPHPALIGYWHNWNDAAAPYLPLDQIDPRYNVIEVSFAEPVVGSSHDIVFTPSGNTIAEFTTQVAQLRAAGKVVSISIGGANAPVHLDSDQERDQFVASMVNIIDAYGFDGMDIDLEGSSISITGGTITAPVDATIIRLIDAIRGIMAGYRSANGSKLFLTMAPETAYVQGGQSAFGGLWGAYLPVIHALRDSVDILQVQLYNSGSMYGLDGVIYEQGTADFIVSQTEAVIQGFSTSGGVFEGMRADQIAVALPACVSAAGGGYADTATVFDAVRYLLGAGTQPGAYALQHSGGYPDLRGLMTWSINWDAAPACNGSYSFAENYERIFADFSTEVQENAGMAIAVFPNPASDLVRIELPPEITGQVKVLITNAVGQHVLEDYLSANSTITLATEQLEAGLYTIQLQDTSGLKGFAKVFIAH